MADRIQSTRTITDRLAIASFGFVSIYLVRSNDGYIAFDAGMRPASVRTELHKLGIDPTSIRHLFLTHSDTDHVGGLPAFPAAAVYFPEEEVAMITRKVPRFFGFIYSRDFGRPYRTVADGEVISLGDTAIKCISTPGHTAGSMSFLVNDSVLIVGDEFNLKDGKAVLDRAMIATNNSQRRESILKLARIPHVDHLCTMHSGYTDNFDHAMQEWRPVAE